MPDSESLRCLRRACDTKPHKIKEILMEPRLRKEFFESVTADEKKVVAAFVSHNQVNMLKTQPRDYSSDNPNLPFLRLRSFTIGKQLRDEELVGTGGITRIANFIGILTPFVSVARRSLTDIPLCVQSACNPTRPSTQKVNQHLSPV